MKPVCGATSSSPFRCQKMNQEKDPTDAKEQNEKWKLENEKESPLKKSEGDVVDPQKPLGPQNLNGALREKVQFVGIPKADYAM